MTRNYIFTLHNFTISCDLRNPITQPANNQFQKKSAYRFVIDTSNEAHPIDWYNACFEIDFKITKMDNINYGANDGVATINGGFSLINQLKVDFNGIKVSITL